MSRLQSPGSLAWAAVAVALLSSGVADAQDIVGPRAAQQTGGLIPNLVTGAQYDIVNEALAERHLRHAQAKIRRDAERGDPAAVDRDTHRIDRLRYRIAVDEWLIRKNACQELGYYPLRDGCVPSRWYR